MGSEQLDSAKELLSEFNKRDGLKGLKSVAVKILDDPKSTKEERQAALVYAKDWKRRTLIKVTTLKK